MHTSPASRSLFVRKKDITTTTVEEQQKQHFDNTIPSWLSTRHLSTPVEGYSSRTTKALAKSATTANLPTEYPSTKAFLTKDELQSAVNQYCNSPNMWENNSEFNDYG